MLHCLIHWISICTPAVRKTQHESAKTILPWILLMMIQNLPRCSVQRSSHPLAETGIRIFSRPEIHPFSGCFAICGRVLTCLARTFAVKSLASVCPYPSLGKQLNSELERLLVLFPAHLFLEALPELEPCSPDSSGSIPGSHIGRIDHYPDLALA
jgi:hypothetical protein